MSDSTGYLTVRQLGPFLRGHGFPIGNDTIKKMTLPSRNSGPPHVGFWGQRKLFAPDEVLVWAKARLTSVPARRDQDEHTQRPPI
jgi:hypothetical protein